MATNNHILSLPLEASSKKPSSPNHLILCASTSSPHKPGTPIPDLKLEATEGSSVFSGWIYSSRLSKLLTKDSGLSVSTFEIILSHLLLQEPLPLSASEDITGIDLVAFLVEDGGIKLRFQRKVGDVRKHVAETSLLLAQDEDIDVVEWTLAAVAHSSEIEREAADLRIKLGNVEQGMGEVKNLLDELRREKESEQEILVERMGLLLNEKKARIRELESQLGRGRRPWDEVGVKDEDEDKDQLAAASSRGGRNRGRGRGQARVAAAATGAKAGASRPGKRKQPQMQPGSEAASGNSPQHSQGDDVENEDRNENEARLRHEAEDTGMETDRGSLQELPEDEDETMGESDDPDDLDDQPSSQLASQQQSKISGIDEGREIAGSPIKRQGRQHVLRGKQKEEVVEESTDDEL